MPGQRPLGRQTALRAYPQRLPLAEPGFRSWWAFSVRFGGQNGLVEPFCCVERRNVVGTRLARAVLTGTGGGAYGVGTVYLRVRSGGTGAGRRFVTSSSRTTCATSAACRSRGSFTPSGARMRSTVRAWRGWSRRCAVLEPSRRWRRRAAGFDFLEAGSRVAARGAVALAGARDRWVLGRMARSRRCSAMWSATCRDGLQRCIARRQAGGHQVGRGRCARRGRPDDDGLYARWISAGGLRARRKRCSVELNEVSDEDIEVKR